MDNLENKSVDDIQEILRDYKFNQTQLDFFKDQEIDGLVLENLMFIPDFPGKTIGSRVRFQTFFKKLTGREINEEVSNSTIRESASKEILEINSESLSKKTDDAFQNTASELSQNVPNNITDENFFDQENVLVSQNLNCEFSTPKNKKKGDEEKSNQKESIPLPKMPIFEKTLETELKKSEINGKFFIDLVNQSAEFYFKMGFRLESSKQYGELSIYLIQKYPSIKLYLEKIASINDRSKTSYCQQLYRILSDRISKKSRNLRFGEKQGKLSFGSPCQSSKVICLDKNEIGFKTSNELLIVSPNSNDESDYVKIHLRMRENYCNESFKIHMAQLLKDSFSKRRQNIKSDSSSLLEKLVEYNFFGLERNVSVFQI
ncbi:unnamed protein product [Brachionus calyciflorus]|uniref:Uncharacterized protein n=1 Tax=Brachionus calyciflorus TaxID=104777 RepID=A0A814JKE7_9BILA|nr:unnamed protein product [Brachionus calyciflorus]